MSGTSDKARQYLEESVPQLQELLRKNVFTEAEIKSIARKRSDFEHTINARGHTGVDYADYVTYESNLAALIKKRTTRLNVKLGVSGHEGPRKIFFILERGVRKFPGDLGLWMQLIEFARKEKARKKLKEIFTRVLRLHPTKYALWVLAAKYMLEDEADITGARGYLQRGLRFCQKQKGIWLEFGRLECLYVGRVAARRKILGLDAQAKREEEKKDGTTFDADADEITLPTITGEDINPTLAKDAAVDAVALQNLENTPALTGAIPIAIFDAAMKEFENDDKLALEFFDMASEFERSAAFDKILRHIVSQVTSLAPNSIYTITCQFMLPISGLETTSEHFPAGVQSSLEVIRESMKKVPLLKKDIARNALAKLLPIVCSQSLDPDIRAALAASLRLYIKAMGTVDDIASLVLELQENKRIKEARVLMEAGLRVHPADQKLLSTKARLEVSKQQLLVAEG